MPYGIYHECCRYIGKQVEILDRDGKVHRGIVDHVTNEHVYFRPVDNDFGGYGYGYGFGAAAGVLALAAIVSIAAYPFGFYW